VSAFVPGSELDKVIFYLWRERMVARHFRYTLDTVVRKRMGKYTGTLCIGRASKRKLKLESSKPSGNIDEKEECFPVWMPFAPDKFHFLKIKPEELLFTWSPEKNPSHNDIGYSGRLEDLPAEKHLVIINVNPVSEGHILFVPNGVATHNQFLTKESLQAALEFFSETGPSSRMLYNSIGAFSSVNHNHFQIYYTHVPEPIEKRKFDGRNFISDVPLPYIHLEDVSLLETLVNKIMAYVESMQGLNIAHNIFFSHDGVFIFPRKRQSAVPDETKLNIGTMEAAGHFILKSKEHFNLTVQDLEAQMRNISLDSYEALLSRSLIALY